MVRDRDETETFDFQSETRSRPRPSLVSTRPRRDRDVWKLRLAETTSLDFTDSLPVALSLWYSLMHMSHVLMRVSTRWECDTKF